MSSRIINRERYIPIIEFTDEEKGRVYYRDPDGRLVWQPMDDTVDYRADELAPEVVKQLNRSRARLNYPSRPMIDNLINMQKSSVEKAVTYVKYRLLGEASYLDVFGKEAEDKRAIQTLLKKQEETQQLVEAMAAQMKEMQILIFNMAKEMNRQNKEHYGKRAI